MSNLGILEEINKYKEFNTFETKHKNKLNDTDLYICKVEKPNKNDEYVYLTKNGYDEIEKEESNSEILVPLLNPNQERHVLYCAGKSGEGKGVFVGDMTRQYHIIYPNNRVFYICSTPIKDDLTFSKMASFISQINLNSFEEQSEERILKALQNSLIIVDDNDNIPKEEKDILNSLQKTILFLGRKYKISLFKISHYKTDSHNTRAIIPELDYYVTFINRDIKSDRMLKEYKKLSKKTYDILKGGIWAFFNFRMDYCITNKKIFFLD